MNPAQRTHVGKPADRRRITLCGQSIDQVPLVLYGAWPTCRACESGLADNPRVLRAMGLEPRTEEKGARP